MLSQGLPSQDIERVIHEEIFLIMEEHHESMSEISNKDKLHANLGLTSSELVQLAAILTTKLQVDPFEQSASITEICTVGELCQAYQALLCGISQESTALDALFASQKRAQVRRGKRMV